MDARIIVFNDGLSDICRPVCRVRHLGTDFVFSYTVDGLSIGNCCVGAQYYCYSVDGGNSWEQLVAGGIIRWPDSYEISILVRNWNQKYPILTCRTRRADSLMEWEDFLGNYDFPGKSDIINAFKLKRLVGDIVFGQVDFEDYKLSGETLYDFFVNPQPETTMRDEQISRALDRLKTIL